MIDSLFKPLQIFNKSGLNWPIGSLIGCLMFENNVIGSDMCQSGAKEQYRAFKKGPIFILDKK